MGWMGDAVFYLAQYRARNRIPTYLVSIRDTIGNTLSLGFGAHPLSS